MEIIIAFIIVAVAARVLVKSVKKSANGDCSGCNGCDVKDSCKLENK